MGEGESAAVITILGRQIDKLGDQLESSRVERKQQVESVRMDMQAGFSVLHKRVSDSDNRLRALEISHAANMNKCGSGNDDWLKDIGTIDGAKKRVTGLVALALVVLLGLAVIIWGPKMVDSMLNKTDTEKVVHQR
ncbi:hypothetical protein CCP3SC15_1110002 [Gammaproteobacteria bacterium]